MGAESLLGQGDMLYLPPGTGYPQRVHWGFVADDEVHKVVEYLKARAQPQYIDGILEGPEELGADAAGASRRAMPSPIRCMTRRWRSSPNRGVRRFRWSSAICGSATTAPRG
jgi:DNA segregation ATPase FtsK/SpoIIIE-like protein